MTQLELARIIRSFMEYHTPDVEMNYQSYEYRHFKNKYGLWSDATTGLALSPLTIYKFPKMDFLNEDRVI